MFFSRGVMGVEDAAYAFGRGVVVVGGVDREEFGDQFRAVWECGVHVGEGAAAGERLTEVEHDVGWNDKYARYG